MELVKPINGIFLDIGWTLNCPVTDDWFLSERFYSYVSREILEQAPQDKVYAVRQKCMKYLAANHLVLTEEAEYEQYKMFYRILLSESPEISMTEAQIEDVARDRAYSDEIYRFYDDVPEFLRELKAKYKLGIISDTWPSMTRVLKAAGLYDYFDSITFSCDIGVFKPDKRMYTHALNALGVPAEQTIFVDDLPHNIAAAYEMGIQPVLIDRKGIKEPSPDYVYVRSLEDLLKLL